MTKYTLHLILSAFFISLLGSCSGDEAVLPAAGKVSVAFSIDLPHQEEVPVRAYTDMDMMNMTLLVFDENNKFMERIDVDASDITPISTGVKFSAMLDATANNRVIHLIANARAPYGSADRVDFSALLPGDTEAQIIPNLTTTLVPGTGENAWIGGVTPLVMWGRVSLNGVSITESVSTNLLRSVACVRLKKATSGVGLDEFELGKMTLQQAAGQGYVAPAAYQQAVSGTPATGNPFAAAPIVNPNTAWTLAGDLCTYVYEGNYSGSDELSVILHASYQGEEGYYKIALVDSDKNPLNIIRNHRYTINVLSVTAAGFADSYTAYTADPSNAITVTINDEDTDQPYLISDGNYSMGINCNRVRVLCLNASTAAVVQELLTVYSNRDIPPVISCDNPGVSLSTSYNTLNHKYTINGVLTAGQMQQNSSISIRYDNLQATIPLEWLTYSSFPDYKASDADSYVFDPIGSESKWEVWVPQPTVNSHVHLHPTNNSPGLLTGNSGNGLYTSLRSDYFTNAYLHVGMQAGRSDVVISSLRNGVIYRRTVIVQ